jgi:hypothetical protein
MLLNDHRFHSALAGGLGGVVSWLLIESSLGLRPTSP